MSNELGLLLRQLRKARRDSLANVAERSGIHRVTLNRWETGQHLPRLPELQATLAALGASENERQQALCLLNVPRGQKTLFPEILRCEREYGELRGTGGDLLRAMRLRRAMTLEDTARQVGVEQSTLTRWERGETWPSTAHLHTLCLTLDAQEAELYALTNGRFALAEVKGGEELEMLTEQVETLQPALHTGVHEPLMDLQVLSVVARLHALARSASAHALPLLGKLQANYAQYLYLYGRDREAEAAAVWVLEQTEITGVATPYQARALINALRSSVRRKGRSTRRHGVELLRLWVPAIEQNTLTARWYLTWALEMQADLLSQDGHIEEALACMRASVQAERQYREIESPPIESRRSLAQILLRAGRLNEAQSVLEEALARPRIADGRLGSLELLYAETLLAAGNTGLAQERLQHVYQAIEISGQQFLRRQAEALAMRL
jgi:transcriptional regulator with XRE-family HTH domain